MADERWRVDGTEEVKRWMAELRSTDPKSWLQAAAAIDVLEQRGPSLGRPLVDRIEGSVLANLKELRASSPPTRAGRA